MWKIIIFTIATGVVSGEKEGRYATKRHCDRAIRQLRAEQAGLRNFIKTDIAKEYLAERFAETRSKQKEWEKFIEESPAKMRAMEKEVEQTKAKLKALYREMDRCSDIAFFKYGTSEDRLECKQTESERSARQHRLTRERNELQDKIREMPHKLANYQRRLKELEISSAQRERQWDSAMTPTEGYKCVKAN